MHSISYIRVAYICLAWLSMHLMNLTAQPVILQFTPNSDSIPALETFEVRVEVAASIGNAYDPLQARLTSAFISPIGDTILVPGFFIQDYDFQGPDQLSPDGPPAWRLRFTPEIPGHYQWRLIFSDTSGSDQSAWQDLWCTDTLRPGFIRPGKGLYLKQDGGKHFFLIGENMAWSTPEGSYAAYQTWIDSLTAYGGNFIKVMMVPWSLSLEWTNTGLGNYAQRQDRARHIDWLLDLCRDKGVYVQWCFMIHDELSSATNNTWAQNPYNAALGGPCSSPIDFFTDSTAKHFFYQRLGYIMARWGHHPAILSWEILSEADRVEGYSNNKPLVTLWLKELTQWLQIHDPHHRMITAGFASSENDPFFWADTAVDYTQIHLYSLIPDLEAEVYTTAVDYIQTYNKNYILGEYALAHNPDTVFHYDPEGIAFRNALWTSALSGSMGCGKTWWWDNYIHPNGHFRHFLGISSLFEHYKQLDDLHTPFRPRVITAQHDTLAIEPRFLDLFAKAPENTFEVEAGGLMFPINKKLGKYLYGKGFVTLPFRNPPTFKVFYPEDGEFIIRTGNYAPSTILSVSMDGQVVWTATVVPNADYSIFVDSGPHLIKVENAGTGNTACEVDQYLFYPYRSEARAFALGNGKSALGWIQHQEFHWPQWYAQAPVSPVNGAIMTLPGYSDSLYTVDWINPWTGQLINSQLVTGSGDTLLLAVPQFQHDIAFCLRSDLTFGLSKTPASQGGIELEAYPNPSYGEMTITMVSRSEMDVTLDILDFSGRLVHVLYQGRLKAGKRAWLWDPAQQDLAPGLYICRAMSGQTTRSIKLIIR